MLPEKLEKSTRVFLFGLLLGIPHLTMAAQVVQKLPGCKKSSQVWGVPFWKTKKQVRERMRRGELFVSVTSDEKEKLKILKLKGVGWVGAPARTVERKMLHFGDLKKLAPEQLREVTFDAKESLLFVHGVAMGWHARMHMRLCEQRMASGDYRLHFHVERGNFKGMRGFFEVVDLPSERKDRRRRTTEFSMTGFYESEKLPLPAFLLSFGLEAVLRVVAIRMRKYFEGGSAPSAPKNQSGERPHERQKKVSSHRPRASFGQFAVHERG